MPNSALRNTILGTAGFGIAAALIAIATHGASGTNADRLVLTLMIQLPMLVVVAGAFLFAVNAIGGWVNRLTGMPVVAATVAGLLAWMIAEGPSSFAGLGFHDLLRGAYALAAAVPWLWSARTPEQVADQTI